MPAVSKAQQRFFGLVKSMQKGDIPKKGSAGKAAKTMDKDDVDDFASTKHKGKPEKVKREQRVRNLIKKMVREILDEDFAGAYPKEMRKKFDNKRKKQSEVLGYKLTGKDDIKTEIDDATVKEGRGPCWKGYTQKGMKKKGNRMVPNCVKNEEITEEVKPTGGMAKIAKIVKDKQHAKVGGQTVDMQSANLLMKLYNAVKDKDKEKMNKMNEKKLIMVLNKLWSRVKLKLPT